MTILVVGGTGFVGRNLVRSLAADEHEVIAISASGAVVPEATFSIALAELDQLPSLPSDTILCNVAAQRYDASRFDLAQSDILSANVALTNRLYEFCAARGIKEVRNASSVAVYQAGLPVMDDQLPLDLNAPPNRNEAFYAWSKRWAEIAAALFADRFGISTVSFRLSNPYGPYDATDEKAAHVLPAFVIRALGSGDVFQMRGDPYVERDFIFIDDVIDIFKRSLSWRGRNETYNLCRGETTSLYDLAVEILAQTGGSKEIILESEFAPAAVRARCSTSNAVRQAFAIERFTNLAGGLAPTIAWYREALGA
jgi:nucleoside-diphosphate-sugar epimerase